jgi:hypothetical protein
MTGSSVLRRLSPAPATVVAAIALFVALSGGAVAATLVTGADIKNNTVGSADIRNGTITLRDISPSTRTALAGRPGPRGIPGPQGIPGSQGAPGGFNPAKVTYVVGPSQSLFPGDIVTVEALCPAGQRAIGGGHFSIGNNFTSATIPGGGGWQVSVGNDTSIEITASAFAVCAAP